MGNDDDVDEDEDVRLDKEIGSKSIEYSIGGGVFKVQLVSSTGCSVHYIPTCTLYNF